MIDQNDIKAKLEQSLLLNLRWFETSGIMDPADGTWGVAERIVLTGNNSSLDRVYSTFPCYVQHDGYSVIEHRRPDCNFEVALLYLLSGIHTGENRYTSIAENIVRYLYRRSGTRCITDKRVLPGMWRWAAPQWVPGYWLDDNSWNCTLSLALSRLSNTLEDEYQLRSLGLQTADSLEKYFSKMLDNEQFPDDFGGFELAPHFAALAIMAFAYAYNCTQERKYAKAISRYIESLDSASLQLTTSEHAYLMIGASVAASAFDDENLRSVAVRSGDYLVSVMDERGNIPSQHDESPIGDHLVDLIYTQNWAVLGFHTLWSLTGEEKYLSAFLKCAGLLASIQDTSPDSHLNGCWRGMYDMSIMDWGGGDKYEGGQNSIYSGWTNAPISLAFVLYLSNRSLITQTRVEQ